MPPEDSQPWLAWTKGIAYSPMPNDGMHIRLVRLDSRQGTQEELKLDISTMLFHETPPYEVLSYAWLAHWKLPLKMIHVNQKPSQIPLNLFNFLRQRQSQTEAVYMWIDALCMHQLDDDEKLKQIQLMPEIYGNCTVFTIWLGLESSDVDFSFEYFKKVGVSENANPNDLSFRRLKEIFTRPWWKRLWIVQEVAFGGTSRNLQRARIMCGKLTIDWRELVDAVQKLQVDPSDGLVTSLENARKKVESWKNAISDHVWSIEDDRTFLTLYEESRFRSCSDERDRIIALISMVGPGKAETHSLPVSQLTAREIYAQIAKRVDMANRELEAERISRIDKFDFLRERPTSSMGRSLFWGSFSAPPHRLESPSCRVRLPGFTDVATQMIFSKDFSIMTVKGVLLDEIADEFQIPPNFSSKGLSDLQIRYLDSMNEKRVQSDGEHSILFWRTIFLDNLDFDTTDNSIAPEEILAIGASQWFSHVSQEYQENRCYRGNCPECDYAIGNILCDTDTHIDYFQDPFNSTALPRLTYKAAQRIRNSLIGRSLFLTHTGFPVLGPQISAQKATHVALLAGLEVPVILQEVFGDQGSIGFRIIGEAHVHEHLCRDIVTEKIGSTLSKASQLQDISLVARSLAGDRIY